MDIDITNKQTHIQDFNFKPGQRLQGLAPIGLRWEASINRKGLVVPDGKLPAKEFLVTHYWHDKRWVPIELHPNQPIEVQRSYAINNAD